MFKLGTLTAAIGAVLVLSGCNDKIEDANSVSAPTLQSSAQTAAAPAPTGAAVAGALHVADLYAQKAELNGKTVTVEGNVVKVSEAIMGKNWIHIQDGTGAEGTNDIVFTSATQSAVVGDHVVATGTVATDKDFGYGYFYSVIAEEATFTKK